MTSPGGLSAIVLAAGLSSRMGRSKPLLAYNGRTVIEQIVAVLLAGPAEEVVVVTGHQREAVEQQLANWPVRTAFNPGYTSGEMLASIQVGLQAARGAAALIVLGDLPALEGSVVDAIVAAHREGLGSIIFPSYQMRRGHPILVERRHWDGILALSERQTLREFFREAGPHLHHVVVETPSVLQDMDTPDDYQRALQEHSRRLGAALVQS